MDRYDEAVRKSEMQEHKKYIAKSGELLPLNKYEEIKNPVVARACGEYRKVLNALIKKYGKPHKINIELTREVGKNWQSRQKYIKEQNENLARKKEAENLCKSLEIKVSNEKNDKNILKARLFIEQGEICVYSGRKISINDLKDDSVLEIDRIYPYSRGFDDGYMNKVLVFKSENQNKKNQTPFEAFGNNSEKWNNICVLAKKLPKQKFKRITNEAFKDKESGFLSRNIVDTGYIASLIKNWTENSLEFLPLDSDDLGINSTQKGGRKHVEVISGQLTSAIRHIWGLGEKNRDNHLHHAIDAIIIAFMDAKTIKYFSDFKKNLEYTKSKYISKLISEEQYEKVRNEFNPPCAREGIIEAVNKIFVSRPPRKSTSGALHKERFYKKENFLKIMVVKKV